MKPIKVSVIIVTYNAARYCKITLDTLAKTTGVDYEVIVVDNKSKWVTKLTLFWCFIRKKINKLCLLDENTMFSGGNNVGASLASKDATHFVLLNSDINIKDPLWLKKLLEIHTGGATSYGVVEDPELERADGYCFLIDSPLYLKYQLDEEFKWWWGVTKLQGEVLKEGYDVKAVRDHDDILIHYGGKSGTQHLKADNQNFVMPDTSSWFAGRKVTVLKDATSR